MPVDNITIYGIDIKYWKRLIYIDEAITVIFSAFPVYYVNFCPLSGWWLDVLNLLSIAIVVIKLVSAIRLTRLVDKITKMPSITSTIPVLSPSLVSNYVKSNNRGTYFIFYMKARYLNIKLKDKAIAYTLSLLQGVYSTAGYNLYRTYALMQNKESEESFKLGNVYCINNSRESIIIHSLIYKESVTNKET